MESKQYLKYIFLVLIVISVGMMLFGVTRFWQGYHNIDFSYNLDVVANHIDSLDLRFAWSNETFELGELTDTGSDGNSRGLIDYYLIGLNQIRKGLFYAVGGGILFGAGIIGLLFALVRQGGAE